MKRVLLGLLTAVLAACEQSPPPPPSEPAREMAAAPPAQAPTRAAAPSPAMAREPLPRALGGVALGSTFAEAAAKMGGLDCHENPQGFRVCTPTAAPAGSPQKLEIYLVHERIVSLAYEHQVGQNVWDFLSGLLTRYGTPSLNGTNERDKLGRTHEIYGWKDDDSIYSVRFIWEGEEGNRRLNTTAIALWDRKVYQQWEAERRQEQSTPAESAPAPGEPT